VPVVRPTILRILNTLLQESQAFLAAAQSPTAKVVALKMRAEIVFAALLVLLHVEQP
jgi:hypothetical protein